MSESLVKAETVARRSASPRKHIHFLLRLGPGLITGAADDDPSGIATYSQVGAQFGTGCCGPCCFRFR
jgi:Mn2+/Fe2+ NRAMP family transporter